MEQADLADLEARLRGPVVRPGDAGYEGASAIWNARLSRRPAAVVRCTGAADVLAAVDFVRERDLPFSVKGGGHDYAGNGVGEGVVIDLSLMTGVHVDPRARRARVHGGATWGAVDHETQAFGLATAAPTVSTVGVAGCTLGGGTGHLARRVGLVADNLLSADVVTAAGELVRASDESNPDLFWAIRGGGGNFGVVTSFEFQLHPVGPEILAGQVIHRFEDAPDVLRFYRDFMAEAADEVVCYAFIMTVPPVAPFPREHHGQTAINLVVAHTGDPARGEEALRPVRDFGDPFLSMVDRQSYVAFQRVFDAGMPEGLRWYSRARFLPALSDDVIDAVTRQIDTLPGPFTMVYLESMGGAVNRLAASATAFPHRDAAFSLNILAGWDDAQADAEIMAWARRLHETLRPHGSEGVYVNLLGEDEQARVRAAYGGNFERLVAVKKQWDPANLFRSNHNIPPRT